MKVRFIVGLKRICGDHKKTNQCRRRSVGSGLVFKTCFELNQLLELAKVVDNL